MAARNTAIVREWRGYEADKDIYPNLMFRTFGDADVRDQHSPLNGIIKPINDSFWNEHTPPLDWGCRCFLEQTNEQASTITPKIEKTNAEFSHNPANSGMLFNDNNSYAQSVTKKDTNSVYNNKETLKKYFPYSNVVKVSDELNIHISDFADLSDLEENLAASKKLATGLNKDIYIQPHSYAFKNKNPELKIGKNVADLKTYVQREEGGTKGAVDLDSFIVNAISKANAQKANTVVLDISGAPAKDSDFTGRLFGSTNKINKNIKNVVVIKGDKVASISRSQIEKRDFKNFLDKL